MSDFDCPTGDCGEALACEQVGLEDEIDAESVEHLERNACNKCPPSPPVAKYDVYYLWPDKFLGYFDCDGNEWEPDNRFSAYLYHDDPFPRPWRTPDDMTYRVVENGVVRGWQCRYVDGKLDDESTYMGTYDYAPSGTTAHWNLDVTPHNENDGYAPNLTKLVECD